MPFPSHLQAGWSVWRKGQQPPALSYLHSLDKPSELS